MKKKKKKKKKDDEKEEIEAVETINILQSTGYISKSLKLVED